MSFMNSTFLIEYSSKDKDDIIWTWLCKRKTKEKNGAAGKSKKQKQNKTRRIKRESGKENKADKIKTKKAKRGGRDWSMTKIR